MKLIEFPRLPPTHSESSPIGGRVLDLHLPDQQTLDFWKLTADDPREYARRVAKYSQKMRSTT